jgi:hypothetical protein
LIIILALNLKLSPIKFIDHFQVFLLTQLQGLTVLEQIAQLLVLMGLIVQGIFIMDQDTDTTMDILWDTDMGLVDEDMAEDMATEEDTVEDTEAGTVKSN